MRVALDILSRVLNFKEAARWVSGFIIYGDLVNLLFYYNRAECGPSISGGAMSNSNGKKEVIKYGSNDFDHNNIVWGFDQGPFNAPEHAENAYKKLIREQNLSANTHIKNAWITEVNRRVGLKADATTS
jgi:hypothetical protein